MKTHQRYALLFAAFLCALPVAVVQGEQPTASAAPAAQAQTPAAAIEKNTPPLTEDALRARYVGKMVFLRGSYMADDLNFDMDGKVTGSPATTSFTLAALEIRKVSLSKRKLEIEADRYALHFTGALPYADDSKAYTKVKISKKPVHISIERELVIIPKVKKEKDKDKNKKEAGAAKPATGVAAPAGTAVAAATPAPATPAVAASAPTPSPVAAPAPPMAPGTTTSPAHSAMLMNAALDHIFATDIDKKMMAHLPDYWQEYFKSKYDRHEFTPSDPHVLEVGGDVTAPKVMDSIDPSSNQYAQKYGVAGMTLFRTVVGADGKPEQIAIARPIGFGLDEKAVEAIKASRFKPAMKDGHPVPVVIDVVVTFRIYSNRTRPGSVTKKSKQAEVVASAWEDSDSAKPTP